MFGLRGLWLGHSLMFKSEKQNGSHHAELLLDDSEGSPQAAALLLSYLLLNVALSFGPLQMIGCSLPTAASIPLVFCIISSHTDRHRSSLTASMHLLSAPSPGLLVASFNLGILLSIHSPSLLCAGAKPSQSDLSGCTSKPSNIPVMDSFLILSILLTGKEELNIFIWVFSALLLHFNKLGVPAFLLLPVAGP